MQFKVEEHKKPEIQVKEPKLYRVIIYNDDYTTMDFVVMILMRIFNKNREEAIQIMYNVHNLGSGIAGTYCWDIAQTKMFQARRMARSSGFPLKFSMEEE